MTSIYYPNPINYSILLSPKSIGGSIEFLPPGSSKIIRFIDTYEVIISMFIILPQQVFITNINNTIFILQVTFDDGTTQDIWSQTILTPIIGFSLPQTFFDLGSYKTVTAINLIATNEITLDQHEFIITSGYIKLIEEVTDAFIGGDIHIDTVTPTNLSLSWGQTEYDYTTITWNPGTNNGIVANIFINNVYISNILKDSLIINWSEGNYNSIIIIDNNINSVIASYIPGNSFSINSLLPNSFYSYNIIPYSVIGVNGTPLYISTYTLATVTQILAISHTPYTVDLSWNSGTYSNVIIYCYLYDQYSTEISHSGFIDISETPQYTFSNLDTNISYLFTIFPYNNIGLSNTIDTSSYVVNTLATVGSLYITDLIDTSLILNWNTGSYSFVNISYSLSNTISNISTSNILINNLLPNQYYDFNVYALNSQQNINPVYSYTNTVTLANISDLTINNITNNSLNIYWLSGTFSSINIFYNDFSISNIPSYINSCNITNLIPNSSYTFNLFANNSVGVINPNYASISNITLATVSSNINPSQLTISSIAFNWTGNNIYTSLLIDWQLNSSIIPYSSDFSYTINSLTSNTLYNISLTPYNSNNVPNYNSNYQGTISKQIATLANIDTLNSSNITSSSVILNWTGNYKFVNIYLQDYYYTIINTFTNIYNSTYFVNNLLPNRKYYLNITPYNIQNVLNSTENIIRVLTLAIIISPVISNISETTISVNWSPTSSYDELLISWYITGTNIPLNTYTIDSSYTSYIITNLNNNTSYDITFLPFNSDGIPNYSNLITLQSNVTLATLSTINVDSYTTTTTQISWTGIYSSISIIYNTPSFSNIVKSYSTNSNILNLIPNQEYTFTIYPINSANVINSNSLSINNTTLATVGSISISTIDETRVNASWIPGYGNLYSSISFYWQDLFGNSLSPIQLNQNNINVTNLIPNRYYNFYIIPINSKGIPNTINIFTTSYITLAQIGNAYIDSYTTNSATVKWNTGIYNTVSIYWSSPSSSNLSGTTSNIVSNSQLINGLVSNTIYNFIVIPYNLQNTANNINYTTTFINTHATVGIPSIITYKSSLIDVAWATGSYTSITLTNGYTAIQNISSYHSIFNNLSPNTQYIFTIIPINLSGVSNINGIQTINATTLATIGNISVSTITSTTINIQWILTNSTKTTLTTFDINSNIYVNTTSNLTNSSLLINNLLPNRNYQFTITPFNSINLPNSDPSDNGAKNISTYTLATINSSLIINNIGISYANINWSSGYYNNISIAWSGSTNSSSTIYTAYSSPYTVSSLIPNGFYTFTATPINYNGIQNTNYNDGGTVTSSQIYTLAVLSSINITTFASSNLTVSFYPSSFFVSGGSVNLSYNSTTINNINTNTYNIINLQSNRFYTFSAIPVNTVGVPNTNPLYTVSVSDYTLAISGIITVSSITDISAFTSWDKSSATYNYISYVCNVFSSGAIITQINNIPLSATPNVSLSGLISNTKYSITMIPYNNSIPAIPNNNEKQIYQFVTLATLNNVSISNLNSSTLRVNWSGGTFTNVNIAIINTSTSTTVATFNTIGSTILTYWDCTYTLSPNTTYTFTVTPNNSVNIPNPNYSKSATTTTLATVGIAYISNYTTNFATVNWLSTNSAFSYIIVTTTSNVFNINTSYNILASSSSNYYTVSNLLPNGSYTINLVAYNSNNLPNYYSTSQTSIVDLATIGNISLNTIGSSNAIFTWSASTSFSSVITNINRISDNSLIYTQSNVYNTYSIIDNLVENTNYILRVIPVNSVGISNPNNSNSLLFTTLSSVKAVNLTTPTTGTSNVFAPITINNLLPNTYYTFNIIPFKNNGIVLSSPISTTILTLPSVDGQYISNITSSSMIINWNSNLSSLSYYKNVGLSWQSSQIILSSGITQYTVSNLNPNTIYNYSITPYNNSNIPGNSVTVYDLSLGIVSFSNFTNINTTNFNVNWYNSNTYFNINLAVYQNNTFITNNLYINGNTKNISGLTPNTTYTIFANANNNNLITNPIGISTNQITNAMVSFSNIPFSDFKTSGFNINWIQSPSYSNIHIIINTNLSTLNFINLQTVNNNSIGITYDLSTYLINSTTNYINANTNITNWVSVSGYTHIYINGYYMLITSINLTNIYGYFVDILGNKLNNSPFTSFSKIYLPSISLGQLI